LRSLKRSEIVKHTVTNMNVFALLQNDWLLQRLGGNPASI